MDALTKNKGVLAAALSALFLAGFFLSFLLKNGEINHLNSALTTERLKSEKLLSGKMETEKEVYSLKNDNNELSGYRKTLQAELEGAHKKLSDQQTAMADAKKKSSLFTSMKKQVKELNDQIAVLQTQLSLLKTENLALKETEERMSGAIASLTGENEKLKENNILLSSMMTNNVMVEAMKGKKDKLTVIAKRTNKLQTTFDLPESMAEDLSFKITGPDGKTYRNAEKNVISYSIIATDDNLQASAGGNGMLLAKTKRVKLIFRPSEKLKKGIYTINVENKGVNVGKMQVRLK